jgi:cell division protein FtsI/penicillin-binding protein 2
MTFLIPLVLAAAAAGTGTNDLKSAANAEVSYIAIDVRTRAVIEQHWPDPSGPNTDRSNADVPIPVGSLVKPFTALASRGAVPEFDCKGTASGCWLPHGHGHVRFREALAQSCNAYFLDLAGSVDPATLAVVAAKFGIAAPEVDSAQTRIGLGDGWRISPLALVRAYAELASRASEPRVGEILAGLELAAKSGTASAIGRDAFAKTGTARGVKIGGGDAPRYASEGFTVVLAPVDSPRIAILVRVHGVTGAEAAKTAHRILREMRVSP